MLEKALQEAREKGYIGKNILGTDFAIDINIQRCPNRYVAGEETPMIEAIEGRAAKPWQKPPFYPANRGLFGKPTLINNTCNAKMIMSFPAILSSLKMDSLACLN